MASKKSNLVPHQSFIEMEAVFGTTELASTPLIRQHNPYPPDSATRAVENTMLLVLRSGGLGSCRSRERRRVVSRKETQFCGKSQQIRKRMNPHVHNNRDRSKTTHKSIQALPSFSAAATWGVAGARRCWVTAGVAIAALFACAVCCCR